MRRQRSNLIPCYVDQERKVSTETFSLITKINEGQFESDTVSFRGFSRLSSHFIFWSVGGATRFINFIFRYHDSSSCWWWLLWLLVLFSVVKRKPFTRLRQIYFQIKPRVITGTYLFWRIPSALCKSKNLFRDSRACLLGRLTLYS